MLVEELSIFHYINSNIKEKCWEKKLEYVNLFEAYIFRLDAGLTYKVNEEIQLIMIVFDMNYKTS